MSINQKPRNIIYRNLANIVSILGVLPICLLYGKDSYQYIIPLIIYNNIMDDLDGILACKLNIRSTFGALLDNVCDAVVHVVFVMFVGMYFFQKSGHSYLGMACLACCLMATATMIVRVVSRINPSTITGAGSPTNELIRHVLFILLLSQVYDLDAMVYLIIVFLFNSVTLIVPFKMSFMIRSLTKSAAAVGMVNIALLLAWLFPSTTAAIATSFFITYLASFFIGAFHWYRNKNTSE